MVDSLPCVDLVCQRSVDVRLANVLPLRMAPTDDQKELAERVSIGDRLRSAREAIGLRLEDVGEALGVVKQTVGHWETGARNFDAATLRQLVLLYGTTADAILGTAEFSEPAALLASAFDRLPKERQEEAFIACSWTLRQIQRDSGNQPSGAPRAGPRRGR
jgi:transcriptional regulator with XRE-family HTH domain